MCSEIQYTLSSSSSIGTQTETKTYADISCQTSSLNAEQILEDIGEGNLSDNDLEFLVSNIFPNLEDKILNIFVQINDLDDSSRVLFFKKLVDEFSSTLFTQVELNAEDLYKKLESMSMQSQIDFYSLLGKTFNRHVEEQCGNFLTNICYICT